MIGATRIRASRLPALALAALLVATLVAAAAGSASLRAASASFRALQMAAGVLCAPGEDGAPAHPAGHGRLGDCCCPVVAHSDTLPPPTTLAQVATPLAIARVGATDASSPGHPAGWRFIEARGPPPLA